MAERTIPKKVEDALRLLSADRTSGASSLLELAAGAFSALCYSSAAKNVQQFVDRLESLCIDILGIQPFMAPLYNLCAFVLEGCDPALPLPKLKKAVARAAARYVQQTKKASEAASGAGAKLVRDGSRILTLSSSMAVVRALELAKKDWKKFSVVVLESRPMLEGQDTAVHLAALGIPVEVAPDGAMASEARRCDHVLVGADAITEEVLVNKAGTLALAVACREFGVPVLAVADRSKLLPHGLLPENDRWRDPSELWDGAPDGVRVRNRYFEKVPLKYIGRFLMEDGPCTSKDVASRAAEEGPGQKRLAGLLER